MIDVKKLTKKDKNRRVLVRALCDRPRYGWLVCWDEKKDLVWIRYDATEYSYPMDARFCSLYELPGIKEKATMKDMKLLKG